VKKIQTYYQFLENFDLVAFHGYKMDPEDMRLPNCSIEWKDKSQEKGCPSFSDTLPISTDDEKKAIEYLNSEDVGTLIAYSRGGCVFLQSLKRGATPPEEVYFVAPSWKKWKSIDLDGTEAKGIPGRIIHGGKDDKVPVKYSVELAKNSNLPLYIFPECNHIDILKHKNDISGAKEIKDLDKLLEILPEWKAISTKEDVESQYQILKSY